MTPKTRRYQSNCRYYPRTNRVTVSLMTTVLVVDDEVTFRTNIALVLTRCAFQIKEADCVDKSPKQRYNIPANRTFIFIQKPFDLKVLFSRIHMLLENAH